MISRRNIRVKVMQTIYTLSTRENEIVPQEAERILQTHFEQTSKLLIYLNSFLIEVCSYATTDAVQRSSKHLPNYEDLHVNTKITNNSIIERLKKDELLHSSISKLNKEHKLNKDLIRKVYSQLIETPEYKNYYNTEHREVKEDKNILIFIIDKLMLANENFVSYIEEIFCNWDDDGEMVVPLFINYLNKPDSFELTKIISDEKRDFAKKLLQSVLEKSNYLQEMIIPKLKNWDPERIALIDMILMKMGVAEFLYFETIPPKVTINEYIDLAKDYSTAQSGHFVNGILDTIHKELLLTDKMGKIAFKKN